MTSNVVDLRTKKPRPERTKKVAKAKRELRPFCVGRKKNGERCTRKAKVGSEYCASHTGDAHRPHGLTDDVKKDVLDALKAGVWQKDAAAHAGIGESTLAQWLREGRAFLDEGVENELSEFAAACALARAGHKVLLVGRITAATAKDWKAAAFLLERMFPNEFGKRDAKLIEHDMSEGLEELLAGKQPVQIPLDRRQRIAAILAEEDDEEVVDATSVEE
jgi:hypothetical protein